MHQLCRGQFATITNQKELILGNDKFRLLRIKDPENKLTTINLVNLPNLERVKLSYAPNQEPSLTSLTIKDSSVYYKDNDFSDL